MAAKLPRLERDVAELAELAREEARRRAARRTVRRSRRRLAELLFWPALLAYGEAAVAYAGNAAIRAAGRLATWGVRIGWLAADGAARRAGRRARRLSLGHLGRVAQPLRLARRQRLPDLGLPDALPPARARGHAARRPCSCSPPASAARPDDMRQAATRRLFLVLHVGLVLAAFAGFTLAAGLAALYLWQERRLKRHDAGILLGPRAVARDARHARRRGRSSSRCRRSRSASSRASSGSRRTAARSTR